jgi:hypothetical protein
MALSLDGTTGISASGNIVGNNISVGGSLTVGSFNPASLVVSGNITGGNILTGGVVSATGNITGNFILGNGSQLTGIDATSIQSGTSNVRVVSSGGNVAMGIGGTANVVVVATSGQFVTGVTSVSGNIDGGNLRTTGLITATGNITGGNVATAGTVSATGNVTGGNLLINGNAVITGNLNVQGTETIFNVANLTVNDKDIIVANNVTGGANVDGAGIQAGNPGVATWFFNNATTSWQSNIAITPTANGTLSLGGASNYWGNAFLTTAAVTGNVQGGNIRTAGLISATGNITGGNLVTSGSANIGGAGKNLFVNGGTGAVSASGDISTSGAVSATGNITTAGQFTGAGTGLTGTAASLTVGTATVAGTVTTAAQPNITSVGTLTSLNSGAISSSGNVTGGNILTGGLISATGNITGGNILGGANVNATTHTGTTVSVTANITGGNILTGGLISATGAITGAALTGTSLTVSTGNITGGNLLLSGAILDSAQLDIQTTASNANIALAPNGTGIVTVSTQVSAVGNVTGGNIRTAGLVSATGTVTGSQFNGSGAGLTSIPNSALSNSSVTVNGTAIALGGSGTVTANAATLTGTALNATVVSSSLTSVGTLVSLAVTGNITSGNVSGTRGAFTNVAGTLETAAQTNITSVGTLSALTVTANVQGGNIRTAGLISATGSITAGGDLSLVGNIVDTGPLTIITTSNGNIGLAPNGTGNVNITGNVMPTANATANIGSATLSFNTIFARATSAQYADLAEMYVADANYAPGTVVEFGGDYEITATTQSHSTRVAGIISTAPGYLMNSTQAGNNVLPVALTGRVPCLVVGPVAKGDRLVASDLPGVARSLDPDQYRPACIIGKSLENYNSDQIGTIEVAVGRT